MLSRVGLETLILTPALLQEGSCLACYLEALYLIRFNSNFSRAYGGFALHFPTHADNLLQSLDLSYQKLLQGETTLSSSSSSQSLQSMGLNRTPSASVSSNAGSIGNSSRSKLGSTENVSRLPYIPTSTRRNIPLSGMRAGISGNGAHCNVRSSSAIDLNAANRAVRNMKGVVSSRKN